MGLVYLPAWIVDLFFYGKCWYTSNMDPMGHEFIKATTTANDLIPSNRTNLEILCSKFESVDVLNMSLHRSNNLLSQMSNRKLVNGYYQWIRGLYTSLNMWYIGVYNQMTNLLLTSLDMHVVRNGHLTPGITKYTVCVNSSSSFLWAVWTLN